VIGFTPRILKEDPKSLVRFDHVASPTVNANDGIMRVLKLIVLKEETLTRQTN
jgi:hypothetical protein